MSTRRSLRMKSQRMAHAFIDSGGEEAWITSTDSQFHGSERGGDVAPRWELPVFIPALYDLLEPRQPTENTPDFCFMNHFAEITWWKALNRWTLSVRRLPITCRSSHREKCGKVSARKNKGNQVCSFFLLLALQCRNALKGQDTMFVIIRGKVVQKLVSNLGFSNLLMSNPLCPLDDIGGSAVNAVEPWGM